MEQKLLTVREVAEQCRVHPNTVKAWIHRGIWSCGKVLKLGYCRVGVMLRVSQADLNLFMGQCSGHPISVDPPAPPVDRKALVEKARKRLRKK